jgi:hypothetical protein
VALFGKKKDDTADGGTATSGGCRSGRSGGFNPDKAKKFFEHAQSMHDTGNYGYAVHALAQRAGPGPIELRWVRRASPRITALVDEEKKPNARTSRRGCRASARSASTSMRCSPGGIKRGDMPAALKAADAAAGLGLVEQTEILGRDAFNLALSDRKRRKDVFVKLLDVFAAANCFELAIEAGQVAKQIDPADGPLDARLKQMMAQAAITQGWVRRQERGRIPQEHPRHGQADAARGRGRDQSRPRTSRTACVADAEAAYNENPADLTAIDRYGKALLDRGKPMSCEPSRCSPRRTPRPGSSGIGSVRARSMIRRMRAQLRALQLKSEAAPKTMPRFEQARAGERAAHGQGGRGAQAPGRELPDGPRTSSSSSASGTSFWVSTSRRSSSSRWPRTTPSTASPVLNAWGRAFLKLGGWEDAAIDTFRGALKPRCPTRTPTSGWRCGTS